MLNPWEWAEKNLWLSARGSSTPGWYSSAFTPYVRELLETIQDPRVEVIAMAFSAQSGKTMTEMVALGYSIENKPGPTLFVMPSLTMAQSFSENRLQPLIEDCPMLAKHKLPDRHKFKKIEMILDNCTINLVGANSPSNLASRAAKNLFLDEVDKYPPCSKDEADPISLAMERQKTFRDRKTFISSTPTVEDGQIWQWFLSGDQREYYVPCPFCKSFFVIQWKDICFDKECDSLEKRAESAYLKCPCCFNKIVEKYKAKMLKSGEWRANNPNAPRHVRSYHIAEMYSPWTRWSDLVLKFLRAKEKARYGELGELQNFVNSSLAEPWKPEQGKTRKAEEITILKDERKRGIIPSQVLGLTAGIDTQDNGFYYVIRAWGKELESWLIRDGFVETFEGIYSILWDSIYTDTKGRSRVINMAVQDSQGHRASDVYDFCRRHPGIRPSKGEQRMSQPWQMTTIDRYPGTNNPIPGGLNLVRINTTYYKDQLASRLNIAPADPGAWHLHSEVSKDYVEQMTSEYRDEKGIWQCPKHRKNHFLDCEVLALVAADIVGVKFFTPLDDIEEKEQEKVSHPEKIVYQQRPQSSGGRFW